MATFALAHASHKTLPEPIDGLDLFETAIQVQTSSMKISGIPEILKNFLKSIKIPYLIPDNSDDASLEHLKQIMPLGLCRRAHNSEGVDIVFSILHSEIDGFIECKNRDQNISQAVALEYIVKATNARRLPKSSKSDIAKFQKLS